MSFRTNLIATCLAGVIVSVLAALLMNLTFDSVLLSFLAALLIPPFFCWRASRRSPKVVATIAMYVVFGWAVAIIVTPPPATIRPQRQAELNVTRPLAGYGAIIPGVACGAIFAIARACFIDDPAATPPQRLAELPSNNGQCGA